ncbi:MAG: YrdB family protein [Anaerolineae bacterium]|nr:YrdB family protein [Anaerolineae bacterium]
MTQRREVPKPGPNSLSNNVLVLLIAFLSELAGIAALAYWGWTQHEGILRLLLAVGAPLIAAVIWGVFRVPNDPGAALVKVPGWLRLLIEWGFYVISVIALNAAGQPTAALILAVIVIAYYVVSYEHVIWKLAQR